MNWPEIFLGCFVVGFVLSVMSFAFGIIDMHVHFPWETHVHVGHVDAGHMHGLGPINFATITAFVAWFGGAGYLLTRYGALWPPVALFAALAVGGVGASLVFWFMASVLWSPHENLDPDDYDIVGLLGVVSSPIRAGGTGEILFAQAGARRVAGARSDDGQAIDKGVEVVITRQEKGLVYVRTWAELAADDAQ